MALTLAQRLSFRRFTRGEIVKQHVALNHRRIFILPNKAGLSLALVILLMLIASINYNNSLGFVFTFLLAAAAQASTFYSYKNLSGLHISLAKSVPCFAGEQASININVSEKNQRTRWQISAKHLKQQQSFNLAAAEQAVLCLTTPVKTRGWYQPETITFSCSFPFGIFRVWSPLRFQHDILVYPQPIDSGLTIQAAADDRVGKGQSASASGTDDFAGLKPYQAGQSYRHINWKALAAEKGLYSNVFSSEQSSDIHLDWQSCSDLTVENKISQLCFWVLSCEEKGQSYGLRLPGVELAPNKGRKHQADCLERLALYEC